MADNCEDCSSLYSGGSLAGAIIGTFFATIVLLALIYLVWEWQKKRRMKRKENNFVSSQNSQIDINYAWLTTRLLFLYGARKG